MLRSLKAFLRALLGGSIGNALFGAGLGLVSFAGLSLAIQAALALVQTYVGGISADALGVVLLMGFGEALSIVGSALLVRAAIASAGVAVGRRSSGGA